MAIGMQSLPVAFGSSCCSFTTRTCYSFSDALFIPFIQVKYSREYSLDVREGKG
jgi:hypothetical protein